MTGLGGCAAVAWPRSRAAVTNRSTTLGRAPPSGFARVEMLRISSAYRVRAWPPVACSRRSGCRSAWTVTSFFSSAMERTRWRKKVLPEPYSPMTKRMPEPPSAMRSMSASRALTSRRGRPGCAAGRCAGRRRRAASCRIASRSFALIFATWLTSARTSQCPYRLQSDPRLRSAATRRPQRPRR